LWVRSLVAHDGGYHTTGFGEGGMLPDSSARPPPHPRLSAASVNSELMAEARHSLSRKVGNAPPAVMFCSGYRRSRWIPVRGAARRGAQLKQNLARRDSITPAGGGRWVNADPPDHAPAPVRGVRRTARAARAIIRIIERGFFSQPVARMIGALLAQEQFSQCQSLVSRRRALASAADSAHLPAPVAEVG